LINGLSPKELAQPKRYKSHIKKIRKIKEKFKDRAFVLRSEANQAIEESEFLEFILSTPTQFTTGTGYIFSFDILPKNMETQEFTVRSPNKDPNKDISYSEIEQNIARLLSNSKATKVIFGANPHISHFPNDERIRKKDCFVLSDSCVIPSVSHLKGESIDDFDGILQPYMIIELSDLTQTASLLALHRHEQRYEPIKIQ